MSSLNVEGMLKITGFALKMQLTKTLCFSQKSSIKDNGTSEDITKMDHATLQWETEKSACLMFLRFYNLITKFIEKV